MKWISTDHIYQPIVLKNISLITVGFLMGAMVFGFVHFDSSQNLTEGILSGLLGIFIAYSLHYSNPFLNRVLSWKQQPGLRLLAGILAHTIIGIMLVVLALWIYTSFFKTVPLMDQETQEPHLKIILILLFICIIYNIIYFATYSYYQYARGQLLELKFQRKQTQLQLRALKSQLSPHFLFNSMNTLSSLFQKDQAKAENFIRSLAGSYEYTLKVYETALVSLEEELKFVADYCYLIRTRFGENLSVEILLSQEIMETKVPPLTLQMLVENAVKHNIMTPQTPVCIQISTEDDFLKVSNNITSQRPQVPSLKIGLDNIRSRYKLLTKKSIQVSHSENFIVKLPLIT